ncbi:hypothetical protein GCM10023319_71170 [Nocardia iowensis]
MFEKFTDRARRVVVLAQEEARMLNHNYIGTEHILLGLIHEGEGVAAKTLESLGISLEGVRSQVEEIIGEGGQAPSGYIPFTPRAKKVLELSLREALQLGHNYIGTEHILLGTIREGDGVAAQVLVKLGADLNRVRQQVIQQLSGFAAEGSDVAVTERISVLTAMMTAIDRRGDLVELVADASSERDAIESLSAQFGFTEAQARAVLEMGMRRFTAEARQALQRDEQELRDRTDERISVLTAMITAIDRRGDFVELVADASSERDAIESLSAQFGFTEAQARAVLEMGMRRFTAEARQALQREIQQLKDARRDERQ